MLNPNGGNDVFNTPKEFPQSGFQWSVNYIKKGYKSALKIKYQK